METQNGTWIMHGLALDDPNCILSINEAKDYINKIGFLPLFKNEIDGFSLEEHTVPEFWWCGNAEVDPWEWRELIARDGEILYGKFFDNKAGFISKKWIPYFANFRRDGYDFDSLWDDEKASIRQKKIMDLFSEEHEHDEIYSNEIKQKAGFGKEGEKGFEGTLSTLQMQMYLCLRDFRQRRNKKGEAYGWPIAVYCTPEHLFGYEYVTSAYIESPEESAKRIVKQIIQNFPSASANQISKILKIKSDGPSQVKTKTPKVSYPSNLLKALKLNDNGEFSINCSNPTDDQKWGLEYAISKLKEKEADIIRLHFEQGLTYKELSSRLGTSESRCGELCRRALKKLSSAERLKLIMLGYKQFIKEKQAAAEGVLNKFKGTESENAFIKYMNVSLPEIFPKTCYMPLINEDITTVGMLVAAIISSSEWFCKIHGISNRLAKKIECKLSDIGIIVNRNE